MHQQRARADLELVAVPPPLRLPHDAAGPGLALAEGGDGALVEGPAEGAFEIGGPERDGEGGEEEFEGLLVDAEEEDAGVEAVVVAGGEEVGAWVEGVGAWGEEDVEGEEGVED